MKNFLRLASVSCLLLSYAAASCAGSEKAPPGPILSNGNTGTGNSSSGDDDDDDSSNGNRSNGNTGGTQSNPAPSDAGADGVGDAGSDSGPGVTDCGSAWTGDLPGDIACDMDSLPDSGMTISGDITSNVTLKGGKTYKLSGQTRVMSGATLTIEPCVKIFGQSKETVLVAMPGDDGDNDENTNGKPGPSGKIQAVGEPNAPIVFTSASPVGSRAPGDWGGIMLLGNAFTNDAGPNSRSNAEGLTNLTKYGWHTTEFNTESSGALAYVRIEYVSYTNGMGSETNGLTLGGVGSGTTLHHIMVANSNDDCFEWFGGAVNASYLIGLNCADDSFDTDRGFTGTVQHVFGRQYPTNGGELDSNGFEMDSGQSGAALTTARWSNVTLCGTKGALSPRNPRQGMVLRAGVAGSIDNAIVTGFDTSGVVVLLPLTTSITLTHSLLFDNGTISDLNAHEASPTWFVDQEGNGTKKPAGFCDCWANPPLPFPQKAVPGGSTADFPDKDAAYIGAFKDASPESNWMRGAWVDWSEK